MMAARDQLKKPTDSSDPPPVKRKRKRPEEKALLDSTKHLNYGGPNQKGMTKPLKPIPVFKQGEGEHKRAFYYRIDKTIQSMKKRAEFEEKYKVDVQTDGRGKSVILDREKDEVELEEEKKKIEKLAKKGIVRRTKEEKRVLRRQREKMRKKKNKKGSNNADNLDFDDFKDEVAFGDTVDAPPTLKFRGFEKSSSSKPAEGGGLLLSQKQMENSSNEPKVKKVKLSMAQKVNMERERLNVVAQYRAKKAPSINTG